MKQKLLQIIETKLSELNEQDAEGFIWWNKFLEIVLSTDDLDDEINRELLKENYTDHPDYLEAEFYREKI